MAKTNRIRMGLWNWFQGRADSEKQIYYEGCYGGFQEFLDGFRLRLFVKNLQRQVVMDLGCGTGAHTVSLAGLGADYVVAADLSINALKNAQEYMRNLGLEKNVDLVYCDIQALPFVEDKFDQILLLSVLNHIPTHRHRRKAVLEVYRVLKQGGFFFAEIPMLSSREGLAWRFTEFSQREKWKDFSSHIVYNFSFVDEDICELFQSPLVDIVRVCGSEGGGLRGVMGVSRNATRKGLIPRSVMIMLTVLQMFIVNSGLLERYWRLKRVEVIKKGRIGQDESTLSC